MRLRLRRARRLQQAQDLSTFAPTKDLTTLSAQSTTPGKATTAKHQETNQACCIMSHQNVAHTSAQYKYYFFSFFFSHV